MRLPLAVGLRAIAVEEGLMVPDRSSFSNSSGSLVVPDRSSLSNNSGSFGGAGQR